MQALRSRLWMNLWNNSSHNTGSYLPGGAYNQDDAPANVRGEEGELRHHEAALHQDANHQVEVGVVEGGRDGQGLVGPRHVGLNEEWIF